MDQNQAANEPGSFRLKGSTGYDKTIVIAQNFVPNPDPDNTVDIHFEDVPTSATYSISYIAQDGKESQIVVNVAYDDLQDGGA